MPSGSPAIYNARERYSDMLSLPVCYMPAVGVADVAEEHFGDIDGFLDFARIDGRGARKNRRGSIEGYMADTQ